MVVVKANPVTNVAGQGCCVVGGVISTSWCVHLQFRFVGYTEIPTQEIHMSDAYIENEDALSEHDEGGDDQLEQSESENHFDSATPNDDLSESVVVTSSPEDEADVGDSDHLVSITDPSQDEPGTVESENEAHLAKEFSFSIDMLGSVNLISEIEHGQLQSAPPESNETYTVQADGSVIKSEQDAQGTETTVYADTDGDGLFERVSETWTPSDGGSAQTLSYVSTSGDDDIAVRSGDDAVGGAGSDDFVVLEAANLRIEDFDDTQGDHLVFDTGLGLTKAELEQLVTSIEVSGTDLIVHFGPDVSITLVGVAASTTLGWDDVTVVS